ncbi:MAG: PLP-dependent aminotransferase family protein [Schwartzia sp.]|nr:PLP-dependent aminotransferase family protein [Schwartzia sp. (in: firmicutes)]
MTYSLEGHPGEALYARLYERVKADILAGRLAAGQRLPSKRALAAQLSISTITVEAAYGQLADEGYIQPRPRSGYFVSPIAAPLAPAPARPEPKAPATPVTPAWFADFADSAAATEDFPFSVWAKIYRETLASRAEALLTRAPAAGVEPLRQAIADHLWSFRGLAVSPGQIVIGPGAEYLYSLLVRLFGTANLFGLEDPGYDKIGKVYAACGAKCAFLPLDEDGVRPDAIRCQQASIVHISPSHHFPTGIIMPIRRRYELLAWADEAPGRYLIEDDYDSEFRLTGRPIPTLFGIDTAGRVIYLNTFSRSLAATVRLSYMVLPPALLRDFRARLGFFSSAVSNFEQYPLAEFIRQGHFEKHINRMRTKYRKRRSQLLAAIRQSPLGKKAQVIEAGSGLHFLLRFDTDQSDDDLTARFQRQGLNLAPLARYYQSPPPASAAHTFLINYAAVKSEIIEEAVRRMAACLEI